MDSFSITHIAAIAVGVLVTLFFSGFFSSKPETSSGGASRSIASPESASGGGKKKKKKKKSKGGGSNEEKEEEVPTPAVKAPEPEPVPEPEETPEPAAEPTNGKKKKKKKNKPANGSANESANSNAKTNGAKPNQEQPPKPKSQPQQQPKPQQAQQEQYWEKPKAEEEEWIVETSKKKNRAPKPKPAAKAATAETSVATGESMSFDAKKVGIIIGPKGATMKAIEEATGCKLDINAPSKDDPPPKGGKAQMASVVITGDKDGIAKAKKAINELATKGYARILEGGNFGESFISVHPRFLAEIVGPGGRTIKELQSQLEVKITIPPTDWKPNAVVVGEVKMCKVGIAGSKENIKTCKAALQSIMTYHHHEISHPGLIHEEVYVPTEFFHCIIGPRGSEIKHIKGNFKVDVHMPNSETATDNVIVVGKQTNVDRAILYIQTLIDRDTEQRERKYHDEEY